jgi:hypothetical protein
LHSFQENKLGSRRLIFEDGQVVFQCQLSHGGWREDVVFEDTMEIAPGDNRDYEDKKHRLNNSSDIKHFIDAITGYARLSFTKDTDIYHAFAGMNRYFKEELQANLCHGIPDSYFDWFLRWTPSGSRPPTRRAIAPSWSWSGWSGQIYLEIQYHKLSENREDILRRTWIIWYQRRAHGSEECVLVWIPSNESCGSPPTNFYGGPIEARFPFDCTQTVPTPRTLVDAPAYLEDSHNPSPGSGFLQFWTVSVVFKLDKATSNEDYYRKTRAGSGYIHVGIYGRDARELGIIALDPKWAEIHVPSTHEFILLCEGQAGYIYERRELRWKYVIMLLEWHGNWAERVSLGSIEKDDLSQGLGQGPIWKEIILG